MKKEEKWIEEANNFRIEENIYHSKDWKGYTTEEWMVAFAKSKVFDVIIEMREHEERIKKLELKDRIYKGMLKGA